MAEDKPFFNYTIKARIDKAVNTLLGLLEGVAADKTINAAEMKILTQWVEDNQDLIDHHPYNELVPVVVQALSDGKFTEDERADLRHVCISMRSIKYYGIVTADIQRLQGIVTAIAADGIVSETELESLTAWMDNRDDLRYCWPYDELDTLITTVLADHKIDPAEQKMLLHYFNSFSSPDLSLEKPDISVSLMPGICFVDPQIIFEDHRFCFTGESVRNSREEMKIMVIDRGGLVLDSVSPRLNYLVVGSNGNPCWAYACYGRKIEQVMQYRKKGARTIIVHENDFFDVI